MTCIGWNYDNLYLGLALWLGIQYIGFFLALVLGVVETKKGFFLGLIPFGPIVWIAFVLLIWAPYLAGHTVYEIFKKIN